MSSTPRFNPVESLADIRHEFGEHGGVNMSVEASTTFTVLEARAMPEIFAGQRGPDEGGCYLYGRHFNPTVYAVSRQVAAMEGTEAAYLTASGMSAISTTLLQLCNAGDHIVASNTIYGGTFALLNELFPLKTGIRTTFVDITDTEAVANAIEDKTRLIFTETVSNPTLNVADIPALADIAHGRDLKLVVDSTFTPMVISPAQLGADIVVHSITKFISGASDVIAGAVCGSGEFIGELVDLHTGTIMLLGPTMDPNVAFQLSLRMPHLGLRMQEHSRRTQIFAERLHELKVPVIYPGLPNHKGREVMARQINEGMGFGGILCIDVGEAARADQLMEILQNKDRFGFMAVSLGFFETLMSRSASSTSSEMPAEDLAKAGISDGLVRMSIGYTGSVEQRWQQLKDALHILNMV